MSPVSLFDTIMLSFDPAFNSAESKESISISCDYPNVPLDSKNFVFKAADLFFKHTGKKAKIKIDIKKRIPIGAGLGGGSSDAASTLVSLNEFFGKPLSYEKLISIAALIGADVPFFILKKPAVAQGIGEKLFPFLNMPPFFAVIIYPGMEISTKWAYENFDTLDNLALTKHEKKIRKFCCRVKNGDDLIIKIYNDLEKAVIPNFNIIQKIKESFLKNGADYALMSGSGSSVFGLFYDKLKASEAFKALYYSKKSSWRIYFVKLLI
jgi:4-diphosphocytidyl-2-C-methyl-D-erythritol kinase